MREYLQSVEDVAGQLGCDLRDGISAAEAKKRLKELLAERGESEEKPSAEEEK